MCRRGGLTKDNAACPGVLLLVAMVTEPTPVSARACGQEPWPLFFTIIVMQEGNRLNETSFCPAGTKTLWERDLVRFWGNTKDF